MVFVILFQELNGLFVQMEPGAGELHALPYQVTYVYLDAMLQFAFLPQFTSLQYLLNSAQQAIGVFEHHTVEVLPLRLGQRTGLQRFEVESNRGDRSLELMRHGVDKAVVLFIALNLAHQKNSIENKSSD